MNRLAGLFNFLDSSVTTDDRTTSGNSRKSRVAQLRAQFKLIDSDRSRTLSVAEWVNAKKLAAAENGSSDFDMDLLVESTTYRFALMSFGQDAEITEDQWVHFRMLLISAPSWVAMESVNRWVYRQLRSQPTLLRALLDAFSSGDVKGEGTVSMSLWPKVFRPVCRDEAQVQHMCTDADFNDDNVMDYFEFVSRLIFGDRQQVQLALYDISGGKAPWIPSFFLSGHKFEYIYHSGVVVFGKEYWYGGAVFESEPGKTPFGKPVKMVDLGLTLRKRSELIQYVIDALRWEYTYASYDVLHHNCNCFSDTVVQFLLNGQHIPEYVSMQPVWAEKGMVIRTIKPLLNKWLGGFGQGGDAYGSCRIDDMTDVWRSRLEAGDLAMWRGKIIDQPIIVRILSVEFGDAPQATVRYFTPGEAVPEQTSKTGLPLRELHPVPGHATSEVLARNRFEILPPCCSLGHPLQEVPTFSMMRRKACSICGNEAPPHKMQCCSTRHADDFAAMHCPQCDFELCSMCVAEGCRMQAGRNGGIFSDVLTVELAEELLKKPNWHRFKASTYFMRADQDRNKTLDKDELGHLGDRLCQELGLPPLIDELDVFFNKPEGDSEEKVVEFDLFVNFFRMILSRAVK